MDLTGQIGIITNAAKWSIGWWVEKITHSPAHHTIIAISDTLCVSAEPGGVRYRNINEYGDRIIWTQYNYTLAEATNIAWFADGHIGLDYNIRAFIALGIQHLTRLRIPQWLATHLTSRHRVTCSQLATDILRATNIHPIPNTPVVAPSDWYDLAQQQGWTHTT